MKRKQVIYNLLILTALSSNILKAGDQPYIKFIHHPWVDSVFNSLSQRERIGQIVWVTASSEEDAAQYFWLRNEIKSAGIGGIVLLNDLTLSEHYELIGSLQRITRIPLLFALDNVNNHCIKFNREIRTPELITMEASENDSLIYKLGTCSARQLLRSGISISMTGLAGTKSVRGQTNFENNFLYHDTIIPGKKSKRYLEGLTAGGILTLNGRLLKGNSIASEESSNALIPEESNLIITGNPDRTISEIENKIKTGIISSDSINYKCRQILAAKYWFRNLGKPSDSNEQSSSDTFSDTRKALLREIYKGALTLLENKNEIIPVKELENKRIAVVSIRGNETGFFDKRIGYYLPVDNFTVDVSDLRSSEEILQKIRSYDLIVTGVAVRNTEKTIDQNFYDFFAHLNGDGNQTIIVWFGNPLKIEKPEVLLNTDCLLIAYEDNEFTEDLAAQLIFGGIGSKGSLPVQIRGGWPSGSGIKTAGNIRLQYGYPENAGLSSFKLSEKIDSIIKMGLKVKAFPGCEVMIARKGIVVFHKTYGYHTYNDLAPVREEDLFDLASVTKVSSTLAGLMLLDSEGRFSIEKKLGTYLRYFRNSNKGNLIMKNLLTHQAGMKAWIPFWQETLRPDSTFRNNIFSERYSQKYPLKVADNLYINKNYRKRIFSEIRSSPLGEKKYVYSDLTFIISPGIIEKITGEEWVSFLTRNIYHKIGAYDICFNPYLNYPLSRIIPTEYDSVFRHQLLHGTVHDEAAAMLGGVSGHAGLFATANDLMKLMEVYRRMGDYGGENIFRKDVLEKYSHVQFPDNNNRRGLGFDKPLLGNNLLSEKDAYPAKSVSPESFGHTGYTGTMVWIDPVKDISFVFLCNRVYPTRNNNLLSDLNIRGGILQAIYDSIIDTGPRTPGSW